MDAELLNKTFERATIFVSGYLMGFAQFEVRSIRFHVASGTGGRMVDAGTFVERGKRKEQTVQMERVVAIDGWDHPTLEVWVADDPGGQRARFTSLSKEWDAFLDDYLRSMGEKLKLIVDGRTRVPEDSDPMVAQTGSVTESIRPLSEAMAAASPASQVSEAVSAQVEESEDLAGLEGEMRIRMITHRRREQVLRDAKISAETKRNGHLKCEVPGCGFNFAEAYGELGAGYAHVHHLRPLAEYDGAERTRLSDLAIVCANCHAMIHRGGECRPLEDLRAGRAAQQGVPADRAVPGP